ncbi:TetR/AcrR family transcriptional regulator [Rhodococcus sp. UNC363MFTsu5.1]|uniref:TetR/AcrR family transcriptional regulator n=1 Tax=Rhodococcus sp. UNC363MFTsu5.1 TaxID=1449069 RepID=UPI0004823E98|nr:TetR/AcrR family transcriptional regulator [Rhodococcus sp. UNC363MFTsu5.1]
MARTLGADQAGRETRARILSAALRLFSERGYAGTSITAIAKAVGLSAPGVLHHFPDKQTLLLAVLEDRGRLVADEQDTSYEDLTLADALELMVRTVEENLHDREVIRLEHLCALAPGDSSELARQWSRLRLDRLRSASEVAAERALRNGEVSAVEKNDITRMADLIIATLVGLEHLWLLDENFDMVAGIRTLTTLLANQFDLPRPQA